MRDQGSDIQVGELGGRRAAANDDVADENERLAAEIAAMQAQLDPHAPAAAGLVARLELPEVRPMWLTLKLSLTLAVTLNPSQHYETLT